jgi:hypothetical protein
MLCVSMPYLVSCCSRNAIGIVALWPNPNRQKKRHETAQTNATRVRLREACHRATGLRVPCPCLDQPLRLIQREELWDAYAHERRPERVLELLVDLQQCGHVPPIVSAVATRQSQRACTGTPRGRKRATGNVPDAFPSLSRHSHY